MTAAIWYEKTRRGLSDHPSVQAIRQQVTAPGGWWMQERSLDGFAAAWPTLWRWWRQDLMPLGAYEIDLRVLRYRMQQRQSGGQR
ncbi:MAG: hypothetical protein MI924_25815 [Chloroflexales bacterium]|nr:hypothetical protein [Chloroflexales bacterium]